MIRYDFFQGALLGPSVRGEKLFCRQRLSGVDFTSGIAKILPRLKTEIIKRSDQVKGFVKLPKSWIVERTIAWLNRCPQRFGNSPPQGLRIVETYLHSPHAAKAL